MASWQAHIMSMLLRYQVKRKLHGNTDLASVREILAGGALPVPKDVTYTAETLGGVPGEWVRKPGTPADAPTLLYLHGGGYFACSPKSHRPITAAYARRGFSVFVPDYRLAPEHIFPAAVNDAHTVWNALVARGHAPESMVVSGDSAGGGLSLALLLTLRDAGAARPAAAMLFSPWTDLAATGASVRGNARRDAMFTPEGIVEGGKFYLADTPATNPLASPHYADAHGLPPLLIHCGDTEILRDDSVRLAEKVNEAGGNAQLRIWPVVPHVWQLAQHFVPEARESLDLAAAFLHARVKTRSSEMLAA
jgi:acetyl esterase/lipase